MYPCMRKSLIVSFLAAAISLGAIGCGDSNPVVAIKNIPLKVVVETGRATLRLVLQETRNLGIDPERILAAALVSGANAVMGTPARNIPVLMIVNTYDQTIQYWELTEDVEEIEVRNLRPEEVKLNVINNNPLRVELWLKTENEILIDVRLKGSS
jgi:hypothetical protein